MRSVMIKELSDAVLMKFVRWGQIEDFEEYFDLWMKLSEESVRYLSTVRLGI